MVGILVVEKISRAEAQVIYAYPDDPNGQFRAKTERIAATVKEGGTIQWRNGMRWFEFKAASATEMIGERWANGVIRIAMKKQLQ